MKKLKFEHPVKRTQFMDICKQLNLHISFLQATEAILFYRGKELDNSEGCEPERLVKWMKENVKILRPINPELEDESFNELINFRNNIAGGSVVNKSMNAEGKGTLMPRKSFSSQPNINRNMRNNKLKNIITDSTDTQQILPQLRNSLNFQVTADSRNL